jgi:F0F1-type ATP synthase assembly protein I
MAETPGSRNNPGKAETDVLTDRIKAWRADFEALRAEKEAAEKAQREARMAEIRAKLAARQQK